MKNNVNYQYYVEGDDEKKLLNVLKTELRLILPGKVDKFNAVKKKITIDRIRTLKKGTIIILVYDTDEENTDLLQQNIDFLKKQNAIRDVICIPQVKNLEDELKYACGIKKIGELTHSETTADFKRDLIKCTNLKDRLESCGFDITKFWSRMPANSFSKFANNADKIKI